jgi:tetratricopeptide (TPR) repeat protein
MRLAEGVGDPGSAGYALLAYGNYLVYSGRGPEAYDLFPRACSEADRSGDLDLRVGARWGLVNAFYFKGDLEACVAGADEGIAIAGGDHDLGIKLIGYSAVHFCYGMRGSVKSMWGRATEAEQDFEIGLRSSGVTAHLVRSFVALHCELTGDARTAMAHARRALAGLEEYGSTPAAEVFLLRSLGAAHAMNDEWQESLAVLDRCRQLSHEAGTFLQAEPDTLVWTARAQIALGELDRAEQALEEAQVLAERMDVAVHLPHAAFVLTKLVRARGASREEFEAAVAAALEIAREKARLYEPLLHLEHAEFAADQGDDATRLAELTAARDLLVEMGVPARADEITKQLG